MTVGAGRIASNSWQSYLRRLGNGINGIHNAGGMVTEEDIIANAEKWMKIKFPGNYTVESYYNSQKMKWDLRLRFKDPQEETMWILRQI